MKVAEIHKQRQFFDNKKDILTPKGLRPFFPQKHSKLAVSSSRSPTDFFFIFCTFNCKILS
jgi:hypothetical protein